MDSGKMIDREILYNVLSREVHNIIQGIPMAGLFEGAIINYIFNFIEPYVDAFTTTITTPEERKKVDIDQLSGFASYEIKNKIEAYKKELEEAQQ